jgi:hypothetical protein
VAEEHRTVVVTDTTPLNYLILIGQIDILPQLFTQVLVPAAVMTELRHPQAPAAVRTWANDPAPHWLEIREPKALEPALEFLGLMLSLGVRRIVHTGEKTAEGQNRLHRSRALPGSGRAAHPGCRQGPSPAPSSAPQKRSCTSSIADEILEEINGQKE